MKIVFVGKGSRGDVQPLAALALRLKAKHSTCGIEFIYDFRAPRDVMDMLGSFGIVVHGLPTPQSVLSKRSCISSLLSLTDEEKQKLLTEELKVAVLLTEEADGIVFNIFACEMWFVARHRSIPCVCASTFFVSRAPLSSFEKKLKKSFPELYQKLKTSTEGQVSYSEVEHWMWRLFLDDFGRAAEAVGIQEIPFLEKDERVPRTLPPPTPLMYGISPHVLQRQPYWPESVHMDGYWPLHRRYLPQPSDAVETLLKSATHPILYVGFGSMEDVYCEDIDWRRFLNVIVHVASAHNMDVVLQSKWVAPTCLKDFPSIHHLRDPVPHQWLFPKCSIIVCHGGSGTVSSALMAGRPLLVLPFGFDQFFWGEQVEWLGVGKQCSRVNRIEREELYKAIALLRSESTQKSVKSMAERLSQEDGIGSAIDILTKHLHVPT